MSILQLDDVSLRFKGATTPVLAHINYTIQPGDFVILLGSNGSGKSTLLKLLHREHKPDTGRILFLEKPIMQYDSKLFSDKVAVLTQNYTHSLFTTLTIYENYLLVKEYHHLSIVRHDAERSFLRQFLMDYNPNLSDKLDATIDQLSGGEKQALALAFCLLQPPELLLLDEHTSALDPKTSEQIMALTQKMIAQHHITCMLTTHDLDIALRYGNRILMLHDGKIYKTFDQDAKASLSKEALTAHYL